MAKHGDTAASKRGLLKGAAIVTVVCFVWLTAACSGDTGPTPTETAAAKIFDGTFYLVVGGTETNPIRFPRHETPILRIDGPSWTISGPCTTQNIDAIVDVDQGTATLSDFDSTGRECLGNPDFDPEEFEKRYLAILRESPLITPLQSGWPAPVPYETTGDLVATEWIQLSDTDTYLFFRRADQDSSDLGILMSRDASDEETQAVVELLATRPSMLQSETVSRQDAQESLEELFKDSPEILDTLDFDDLAVQFAVTFENPRSDDALQLVELLNSYPGVLGATANPCYC